MTSPMVGAHPVRHPGRARRPPALRWRADRPGAVVAVFVGEAAQLGGRRGAAHRVRRVEPDRQGRPEVRARRDEEHGRGLGHQRGAARRLRPGRSHPHRHRDPGLADGPHQRPHVGGQGATRIRAAAARASTRRGRRRRWRGGPTRRAAGRGTPQLHHGDPAVPAGAAPGHGSRRPGRAARCVACGRGPARRCGDQRQPAQQERERDASGTAPCAVLVA